MANTYSQLYFQIVFTVKGRENLIPKKHKEELHKFITGVIQKRDVKLFAINSMPDHIHIFIGSKPSTLLSDLVRDIKAASSKFINDKNWIMGRFSWQEGYGAFTYSHSQIDSVINYINNQEEHHQTKSFKQEYISFLEKFNIEYKNEFLFDWID
jgi:REP element-mobilizing transposase RayT